MALLTFNIGLANGWTSPYLAQLTDENALFHVTDEEASWIASLLPLGRLLGAVFGPLILECIGSKMSILSTGLPMVVSWICIIFATSSTWLYISRILSGNSDHNHLSQHKINQFIKFFIVLVVNHIASILFINFPNNPSIILHSDVQTIAFNLAPILQGLIPTLNYKLNPESM